MAGECGGGDGDGGGGGWQRHHRHHYTIRTYGSSSTESTTTTLLPAGNIGHIATNMPLLLTTRSPTSDQPPTPPAPSPTRIQKRHQLEVPRVFVASTKRRNELGATH
uniref:Uncharacterized protein n=1 Tax=Vespula pensylvanica TaxID=30213 RepID=A0A834P8V9_VESPE|nr:hypothetical protein H0235_005220 [Vespula pensylvanica]